MSEKCENKTNETKIPYMMPMWQMYNYPTYPFGEYMWQGGNAPLEGTYHNMPMRCPMCGSFLPMGGFMGYMGGYQAGENVPFPECNQLKAKGFSAFFV